RAMAGDAAQHEGVTAELLGNPHGPSDHSRFYEAGVPVLFFYTGGHGDYHRPTDTADKINAGGMARLAAVAVRMIEQLASDGARRARGLAEPVEGRQEESRLVDADVRAATTLTEMMRRRADRSPDQQYFHLFDETVTYGKLWAQSARYAAGLAHAGVGVGDKVCLIYPTCAEFFYTFFGALRLGAIP